MKYILSLICTSFLCLNLAYSQVQIVASNIGNNFSITYPANLGSPVTIPAGLMITFKSISSISGISTLSVNGSTARTIKKQVSLDLQSGDILNGQFVTVIYDGTFFQILSATPSSPGSSWLIGGNSISGTNTLGTLNTNDLSIVSNNIEGIRISSNTGFVGIGNSNPTSTLHVIGDISWSPTVVGFNGVLKIENNLTATGFNNYSIGLHSKSNSNEQSLGAIIEGGQIGLYSTALSTGTAETHIGVRGIGQNGTYGKGLDGSGNGELEGYGITGSGSSNTGDGYGISGYGNSTDGKAYGLNAYGSSTNGEGYGIKVDGYSQSNTAYGVSANASTSNGDSYGIKTTSSSNTLNSYGINNTSNSQNGTSYGSYSTSNSTNGTSYGNYIQNSVNNGTGTSYGSYIYNSGSGPSYGTFITNYASTGYTSIGLYAGALGGSSNYSGYFAAGDVFVNDKIGVGTNNPSERITVENTSYGITHRDGTSVTMSTYIGNSYTPSFIPGASIGTQSDHPFFIYINNSGEKLYIGNSTQSYNVGIGTNSPSSKLSVYASGSYWDLSSTEGDFSVGYADTYRFKVGVSTGGGGAGDVYLGAHGGTNRMFLGTGPTNFQTMTLANGKVGINNQSPQSLLDVYNGSLSIGTGNVGSSPSGLVVGTNSTVSGAYSITAGYLSQAGGSYCGAFGYQAKVYGNGSFAFCGNPQTINTNGSVVFADYSSNNLNVATGNKFYGVFGNGYALYTNSAATVGIQVGASGTSWTSISDSTKKENFLSINYDSLLYKIDRLTLKTWNYKFHDKSIRHYGPVAQEFNYYFGKDKIGFIGNDTTISTQDIEGLTLTAVQALVRKNKEMSKEISNLKAENVSNHGQMNMIEEENRLLRNEILEIKRHLKLDAKANR